MTVFFYFFMFFLNDGFGRFLTKSSSRALSGNGKTGTVMNSVVMGIVALLFFYIVNGFTINLNERTVYYALIFAGFCLLSECLGIVIFEYYDIATVVIVSSTISLLSSGILGVLLFDEEMTWMVALRIGMMIAASILMFLMNPPQKAAKKGKIRFLLIALQGFLTVGVTILTRYFARDPDVTDANSYFFFSNVIAVGAALLVLLFLIVKEPKKTGKEIREIRPLTYLSVSLKTVSSNIGSMLEIVLLAMVNVSVYSPVTSALSLIASVVVGFLFRERLRPIGWIALALALAAVVL